MKSGIQSDTYIMLEWPITIRPYDIDFAGIVNNQVYVRWLEDMRTELWASLISLEETSNLGLVPVLLETHIEYKLPLRLGDKLVGVMRVADVGLVRLSLEAEFRVMDAIHAKASHKLAIVNNKTLRPTKLPNRILQRITGQSDSGTKDA